MNGGCATLIVPYLSLRDTLACRLVWPHHFSCNGVWRLRLASDFPPAQFQFHGGTCDQPGGSFYAYCRRCNERLREYLRAVKSARTAAGSNKEEESIAISVLLYGDVNSGKTCLARSWQFQRPAYKFLSKCGIRVDFYRREMRDHSITVELRHRTSLPAGSSSAVLPTLQGGDHPLFATVSPGIVALCFSADQLSPSHVSTMMQELALSSAFTSCKTPRVVLVCTKSDQLTPARSLIETCLKTAQKPGFGVPRFFTVTTRTGSSSYAALNTAVEQYIDEMAYLIGLDASSLFGVSETPTSLGSGETSSICQVC